MSLGPSALLAGKRSFWNREGRSGSVSAQDMFERGTE